MRVLILTDYFLPGSKAGGPPRSIAALVHHLGSRAEFLVVTRDRDFGDAVPYRGVATDAWVPIDGASCRYLSPARLRPAGIARLLRGTAPDVLYLNTLFSPPFTHYPLLFRKAGLVPRTPVVLAPRGQLEPGALAQKWRKKRVFLAAARTTRLFSGVLWHATNPDETAHIRHWFGDGAEIREAANLRLPASGPAAERNDGGALRIVFLSRIASKKNLAGALEILSGVESQVIFDVYGPPEDRDYLARCEAMMRRLPDNVHASYRGELAHDSVDSTLRRYDLLLLPSHGENFGHAIAEALAAGCAPLISDRTPWRDLAARGVGWDLPLEHLATFRNVIEECAAEPQPARRARAKAASEWMARLDSDPARIERAAALFDLGPG